MSVSRLVSDAHSTNVPLGSTLVTPRDKWGRILVLTKPADHQHSISLPHPEESAETFSVSSLSALVDIPDDECLKVSVLETYFGRVDT